MKFKINKSILGYILYSVIILVILLYIRFPGRVIIDYIVASVSASNPGAALSVDSARLDFPPGLKLENVTFGFKENPASTVQVDQFTVRPGFINLMRGKSSLLVKAVAYEGDMNGHIDFADFLSMRGPVDSEISLNRVNIEKCTYLNYFLKRRVSGKLNGSLTYHGSNRQLMEGSGAADFVIINGSYQLLENMLGVDNLDFSKVEGRMSFKSGTLRIDKLRLTGTKISCSLQGDIILNKDINLSQIVMNGSIEIPGQGSRKVTLIIGGTLGNPTTRLM